MTTLRLSPPGRYGVILVARVAGGAAVPGLVGLGALARAVGQPHCHQQHRQRHQPTATAPSPTTPHGRRLPITALFARPRDASGRCVMTPDRSSVLFMFFAQWFTDSVLRIDPRDRRRNTSNHDVDLCQIYGLNETATRCLRSGEHGRLRSQLINGQEFPDYVGERGADGSWQVKSIYAGLSPHGNTDWVRQSLKWSFRPGSLSEEEIDRRLAGLYATGLERDNRICAELERRYDWTDDVRLFQTAWMINICLLLKLTVEEYINHIAGQRIFRLDTGFAEHQNWYRTNWIALEFDLLYRWHGLVPDSLSVNGTEVTADQYR